MLGSQCHAYNDNPKQWKPVSIAVENNRPELLVTFPFAPLKREHMPKVGLLLDVPPR